MASLSEVYEGGRGGADLRRLYIGVGMFVVGAVLTVSGIVLATSTPVGQALSLNWWQARELAGVAAGIGLPLSFLGVVTVLPKAGLRVRLVSLAGAAIALFGVLLFWEVYPFQWIGRATDHTLPVVGVYFVGSVTMLWAVFTAVANFKTRNDPGGTVRLEVTKQGQTRVVEVSNDNLRSQLSGIGFFGNTPDGEVETQTAGKGGSTTRSRSRGTAAVSDGGSTAAGGGAELIDVPEPSPKQDVYCGNCSHFKYVRTGDGMKPYCAFDGRTMDDMEPCREWEPNNGPDRV